MTHIKNIRTLSAEVLFGLLKTQFADFVNQKLASEVSVELAHVDDRINVSFPEFVSGISFYLTVSSAEIQVSADSSNQIGNSAVLEKQLIDFLETNLN